MYAFVSTTPLRLTTPSHLTRSQCGTFHPPLSRPARRVSPTCTNPPPTPTPPATPTTSSSSTETPAVREVPFEIRGFSLANVGLILGIAITAYSFSSYFGSNGTASGSSLGFVYGVPILLIGCALKYAELQPVPVRSAPEASKVREQRATAIQKKVFSDITRHRYGDEAHLSATLSSLGLVPRGEPCPELVEGEERVVEGEYCLRLVFYSVATPWKLWEGKKEKFEAFFGPGVRAEVEKVDSEKRLVALSLISKPVEEKEGTE